jgi:hypothetical protein
MTILNKPVKRVALTELDAHHGKDRGRRIVVTLIPAANGDDMIELRPQGTQRPKRCKLIDLYSYLLRCESNTSKMEKLRLRKEAKRIAAEARRSRRIIRGGLNHA